MLVPMLTLHSPDTSSRPFCSSSCLLLPCRLGMPLGEALPLPTDWWPRCCCCCRGLQEDTSGLRRASLSGLELSEGSDKLGLLLPCRRTSSRRGKLRLVGDSDLLLLLLLSCLAEKAPCSGDTSGLLSKSNSCARRACVLGALGVPVGVTAALDGADCAAALTSAAEAACCHPPGVDVAGLLSPRGPSSGLTADAAGDGAGLSSPNNAASKPLLSAAAAGGGEAASAATAEGLATAAEAAAAGGAGAGAVLVSSCTTAAASAASPDPATSSAAVLLRRCIERAKVRLPNTAPGDCCCCPTASPCCTGACWRRPMLGGGLLTGLRMIVRLADFADPSAEELAQGCFVLVLPAADADAAAARVGVSLPGLRSGVAAGAGLAAHGAGCSCSSSDTCGRSAVHSGEHAALLSERRRLASSFLRVGVACPKLLLGLTGLARAACCCCCCCTNSACRLCSLSIMPASSGFI